MGKANPGVDIYIVDEHYNRMDNATADNPGIIAIRSNTVTAGYWNEPEQTAKAMERSVKGTQRTVKTAEQSSKVAIKTAQETAKAAQKSAQAAAKAAEVQLIEVRIARGMSGKAYMLITGTVASVTAAIEHAKQKITDEGTFLDSTVIPNPDPSIWESIL